MLTQFRHIQKGTLIVVTAIIVVAFAMWDGSGSGATVGGADCVVKVYNRCYRQKEANKLANHFNVAIELGMYDFATVLFGENRKDRDRTDFIMSLVVLRKEAAELGIEPTDEEIKETIPNLPIFQQPWVDAKYIQNNILGPNGFTDGDFAQLVKDYLSFQKLRSLIGAGVAAVPSETEREYIKENQRYTASVIRFDREEQIKKISVTDEEVKNYYEENQETLNSLPKRGFSYVKFVPKTLPENATNEQKAKTKLAFANAVNQAYSDLAEEGADFEAIAKQYVGEKADFTMTLEKVAPFAPDEPADFAKDDQALLQALFAGTLQLEDVSVPFETADGGYYVFHYTESVEPVPLTLEQASPAIKEKLLAQKSDRAVKDAANAAQAKINEALAAGKSFAEALKASGLKAEPIPNFSEKEPPADYDDASLVVRAVDGLAEGEISSVVDRPGGQGALLVYVDKIELYKSDEAEGVKNALQASTSVDLDRTMFTAWFNQRRAESGSARAGMAVAPAAAQ